MELSPGLRQGRPIVGGFVFRYSCPVQRLRRCLRFRESLHQRPETLLGLTELAVREGHLGQTELELGEKVIDREKTLKAMLFFPLRIQDDSCGRPLGAESLEALGLLLDVDLHRDKVLTDELRDPVIGVNLGLQPSAPRSHRGGTEIKEDRPPAPLCFRQSGIGITNPVDVHGNSIGQVASKGKGSGANLGALGGWLSGVNRPVALTRLCATCKPGPFWGGTKGYFATSLRILSRLSLKSAGFSSIG